MIWYQGENNTDRGYQYRHLFPLMIQNWRNEWQQSDFPFYWVQLADFHETQPEQSESEWAELREAQTMTMAKLPNTGEAVIIDLGEGNNIHPTNKQDVAKRLARWALADTYKVPIAYRSPLYQSMTKTGDKIFINVQFAGTGLNTFDLKEPLGFAIAGADRKFVWAKATITGPDQIEVWSDSVKVPVAVRYAWSDNPVCNVYSSDHLPLTPFRTDEWPGISADVK